LTGRIRVEPLGVTFELEAGETLMAAATRAGYVWPTICKGSAQCNRCYVTVQDGSGLGARGPVELAALHNVRWRGRDPDEAERLACCLTADGGADAVVQKRGVRPATRGVHAPP
jgi:ferredoxin, 2Fe-2S